MRSQTNKLNDSADLQSGEPIERPPTDAAGASRLGMWVLGIGLGGFLLWAALAPLDEGVPTHGMVTLDTKRKAVQHLTGGIVKSVHVREGDVVKAGQPLIDLDENNARANREAVRQKYLGLRAMQGRLLAEQTGRLSIEFHPDLAAAKTDPLISNQMETQRDLLRARRAGLSAELSAIDESIKGQHAMIQTYQAVLQTRTVQLGLVNQELDQTRPLVADGYAPRNRLLELERLVADSLASQADLKGQSARALLAIAELQQRKVARQQDYRKEIESQLSEVTREVQADAERMTAVNADLERTQIRASSDGQVVGLTVQSVGAVIQPGQKIMDLVPENEPLILETRIEPHLIDKVHTGLNADVRFSSFANTPQLVVEGKILSVSQDLLVDQATGAGYYLARLSITPGGMKSLGNRQLQAGMPAEVVIKTGERSMLTYLLKPLLKRMASSLKEE